MRCFRRWLLLLGWLLAGIPSGAAAAQELSVTFFDVKQGDAALIVSPTGKRVLIDGGPPEAGQALVAALRRHGVDGIDLILLTHPHLDHLGGLARVIDALPVRGFLDSGFVHESPAYSRLLQTLARHRVVVRQATAGRTIDLGDAASLTLLGPPQPFLAGTRSDPNANSVVARLAWRAASALFPGDAEPEEERWLLAHQAAPRSDLLKVAHHGGRYSSTIEFLRAVRPRIAVIEVGAHNDYGHPTPEAMSRLAAVGATLYRTDRDGEVVLRTDGTRWTAEAGRPRYATIGGPPPGPPSASPPSPPSAHEDAEGYLASRRSAVFHRARCPNALAIKEANVLRFPQRESALASGRRPAGDCHP